MRGLSDYMLCTHRVSESRSIGPRPECTSMALAAHSTSQMTRAASALCLQQSATNPDFQV